MSATGLESSPRIFSIGFPATSNLGWKAIAEAAAMFSGGSIVHHRAVGKRSPANSACVIRSPATQMQIHLQEEGGVSLVGSGESRHANQQFAQQFALIAGFRRAGVILEYTGDHQRHLPLAGALRASPPRDSIVFERLFADHEKQDKRWRITTEELEAIFDSLTLGSSLQPLPDARFVKRSTPWETGTYLLLHCDGYCIEVQAQEGRILQHRITGFTFTDAALHAGLPIQSPQSRATWGEAWLPHDVKGLPMVGLMKLDGDLNENVAQEVAVITDRAYRYQIADRASVKRRLLTFAKGSSSSFTRKEWLDFARHYHEKGDARVAVRCLKQAEHQAKSLEEKLEITRLRTLMKPRRRTRVPKSHNFQARPLRDLVQLIDQEFYETIAAFENERSQAYAYSDYGRIPWNVPLADGDEATQANLVAAGMTQEILGGLLRGAEVRFFPEKMSGLFFVELRNRRVWGGRDTGIYFIEGIEDTIFRS